MPEGPQVRQMFAGIARRYDRANHVLSLGIDHLWRRAVVRAAGVAERTPVLDVCAGTGDLSLAFSRAGADVVGSDFCPEMLQGAVAKARRVAGRRPVFVAADTLDLPFADDRFEVATVAFGIRNVSDPVAGLREMARVTRRGGRIMVLEFSKPRLALLGLLYRCYFTRVLPRLGRLVTGDTGGAYDYLPKSVMEFPERERFTMLMEEAGLTSVGYRVLSGGIAALYRGQVPA